MNDEFSTRLPWPANFPEVVIIHTDVRSHDSHEVNDVTEVL
jgi:hypothetical protein